MIYSDPESEITINAQIVKELVREQFPDLSNLEVRFVDSGWDNENYKLGDQYLVRIPKRAIAAKLIEHEIYCLKQLDDHLPLKIPTPVRIGQPNTYIPWKWTINPWFRGHTVICGQLVDTEAINLVKFLKVLHILKLKEVPDNPFRSVPISHKKDQVEERMERLKKRTSLITPGIERLWEKALSEPDYQVKSLIHGDLHPRNIIQRNNKIEAIIDWGDMTMGDVASDLASIWMLFGDINLIHNAFKAYGTSNAIMNRSIGWAIFYGITLLDTGLNSNEKHVSIGQFILDNLNRVK
jgi:aminoglycoside phosphotransferase (APT) family kinase protein